MMVVISSYAFTKLSFHLVVILMLSGLSLYRTTINDRSDFTPIFTPFLIIPLFFETLHVPARKKSPDIIRVKKEERYTLIEFGW